MKKTNQRFKSVIKEAKDIWKYEAWPILSTLFWLAVGLAFIGGMATAGGYLSAMFIHKLFG